MAKYHLLEQVTFTKDLPEYKIEKGQHGLITQIDTAGNYYIQVGNDEMADLIKATENDIAYPSGHTSRYTKHEVFCNACGKALQTDFQRYDGRFCNQQCHNLLDWKKILSMMGKPMMPMPEDAKKLGE